MRTDLSRSTGSDDGSNGIDVGLAILTGVTVYAHGLFKACMLVSGPAESGLLLMLLVLLLRGGRRNRVRLRRSDGRRMLRMRSGCQWHDGMRRMCRCDGMDDVLLLLLLKVWNGSLWDRDTMFGDGCDEFQIDLQTL